MDSLHDFDEQADLVLDVEQVTELEKRAEQAGIPLASLMARAGAALADHVRSLAPFETEHTPRIVLLCGPGNNGGDGWVCARILAQEGYPVTVVATRSADDIKAQPARDAAIPAHKALLNAECTVLSADDERVPHVLAQADIAVDALLGTGFSGEAVTGTAGRLIALLNESPAIAVAADVPSGLSAQTGEAAFPCARANYTVTMLCAKTGIVRAAEACGRIVVAPLGVDARALMA